MCHGNQASVNNSLSVQLQRTPQDDSISALFGEEDGDDDHDHLQLHRPDTGITSPGEDDDVEFEISVQEEKGPAMPGSYSTGTAPPVISVVPPGSFIATTSTGNQHPLDTTPHDDNFRRARASSLTCATQRDLER
ncbi:unnamed protein product, partial [Amoebophrya sp. A120]